MTPVKFFCEFCGSQVRAADRICPHCGSFFSQVRCPACGFQGENKLFLKGCPVCGFATATSGGKAAPVESGKSNPRQNGGTKPVRNQFSGPISKAEAKPAPAWVMPVLIAVFVAVIALAVLVLQGRR